MSRRRVLSATTPASVVGVAGVAGHAGATEDDDDRSGGGSCECPDGTRLVATFEAVDTDDEGEHELEFEKTDTLLDPASSFSFDITLDGDDEIKSVTFDSRPYTVTDIVVKAGSECERIQIDPYAGSEYSSSNPKQSVTIEPSNGKAISNILFCAPAYYQVDLANTTSPPEIPYDPAEFIEAEVGSSKQAYREATNGTNANNWFEYYGGLEENSALTSASVAFTVDSLSYADGTLSLASFDALTILFKQGKNPSLWDEIVDEQVLYGEDNRRFDGGETGELRVSLPTV